MNVDFYITIDVKREGKDEEQIQMCQRGSRKTES